jgi:predicted nuclease with TOPRIM domain
MQIKELGDFEPTTDFGKEMKRMIENGEHSDAHIYHLIHTIESKRNLFKELKEKQRELDEYKDSLKSIQHYTADKKCCYCDQVYRYSKRALSKEEG